MKLAKILNSAWLHITALTLTIVSALTLNFIHAEPIVVMTWLDWLLTITCLVSFLVLIITDIRLKEKE